MFEHKPDPDEVTGVEKSSQPLEVTENRSAAGVIDVMMKVLDKR